MSLKRPSGAEFRKKEKQKEEEAFKLSQQWRKWLTTDTKIDSAKTESCCSLHNSVTTEHSESITTNFISSEIQETPSKFPSPVSNAITGSQLTSGGSNNENSNISLNLNDPPSWPNMKDKVRCCLVERGPDQGKGADLKANRQYECCFTGSWFTKLLSHGNSVDRDWMMYCKTNKSLFCFPCILFRKQTNALSNKKK
jgi:hypothetical protein